jgi:Flp pilus assembly protein TadD
MPTAETFARAVQLHRRGALREAEQLYREVLAAEPGNAPALNYLGMIACQLGDLDAAAEFFRRAIRCRPQEYGFYNNLGLVYEALRRPADAIGCYEQALKVAPSTPELHVGMANALFALDRIDEAETHLRRAVALRPDYAQAHNNLGHMLVFNGRLDDAEAEYNEAVRLSPEYADAHWNRSMLWLMRGDTERGWPEYEWRWPALGLSPRPFSQPRWNGAPLAGRTILLHAEQGLGDTIQFIRFAPLVRERGGSVVVECQPVLCRLLETAPGIDRLVARGEPLPAFDTHAPLLSVPGLLETTVASIPAQVPYLRADPALVERWRQKLAPVEGCKVGIAWQGNPAVRTDRQRSVPLAHFAPLAAVPGVQLISLQVGPAVDQIRALAGRFDILDLGPERSPGADPFQETAAIMQNLDIVVSSDTSVPHLAGALGLPVWLALGYAADWRWLQGRSDSPWYPTMRLFRQSRRGDWDSVFARIATELQCLRVAPAHSLRGQPPVL